jgi:hypothetical protein
LLFILLPILRTTRENTPIAKMAQQRTLGPSSIYTKLPMHCFSLIYTKLPSALKFAMCFFWVKHEIRIQYASGLAAMYSLRFNLRVLFV